MTALIRLLTSHKLNVLCPVYLTETICWEKCPISSEVPVEFYLWSIDQPRGFTTSPDTIVLPLWQKGFNTFLFSKQRIAIRTFRVAKLTKPYIYEVLQVVSLMW